MEIFVEGFLGSALLLGVVVLIRILYKWINDRWKSKGKKKLIIYIIITVGTIMCLVVAIAVIREVAPDWDEVHGNKSELNTESKEIEDYFLEEENIEEIVIQPSETLKIKGLERLTEEVKHFPRDSQREFWKVYKAFIENKEDEQMLKLMIEDNSIYWSQNGNFGGDFDEIYNLHERTILLPGKERPTVIRLMFQMYRVAKIENADGILHFLAPSVGSTEEGKEIFNVMGTLVKAK
ncbi:hypothetical protein [Algoriphagus terrigena]|uniref:hypothetical protein n=1 Tax=Algoriphagus terrigena TaxID=344884 RepID=UPI00042277A3|nr:hypothetical protein [Algoriphagus terrigena]